MEKFCYRCMKKSEYSDKGCLVCGFDPDKYMAENTALPLNAVVGNRYIVCECLYSDGFEHVYTSIDVMLKKCVYLHEYFPFGFADRKIAVNFHVTVINNEFYDMGRALFIQRAERVASLNDIEGFEHIVSHFSDNNTYYMVGEDAERTPLGDFMTLKSPNLTFEETTAIISQVVDVMNALHLQGLFQCDVTPKHIRLKDDNILLLAAGEEKYEFRRKTDSEKISPFTGYGAPELFLNENVREKTDVYAVAALFYHILSGIVLVDILDERYKKIKDIRKVNRMKAASKEVLKAINAGLGIVGEDRASDFLGFQTLKEFDMLPAISLKQSPIAKVKDERKTVDRWSVRKRLSSIAAISLLIFAGCVVWYGMRQLQADQEVESYADAVTDVVSSVNEDSVSDADAVQTPVGTKEAASPAVSNPKNTPKIGKEPSKSEKRRRSKKNRPFPSRKPSSKRPPQKSVLPAPNPTPTPRVSYSSNSNDKKLRNTPRPREEVISGSDKGEENITGIE